MKTMQVIIGNFNEGCDIDAELLDLDDVGMVIQVIIKVILATIRVRRLAYLVMRKTMQK